MERIDCRTPESIYHYIVSNRKFRRDDYTCIIAGKHGPTGKSWLASHLNNAGYTAIEISELLCVSGSVSYNDDKNHFIVDDFNQSAVIILNKLLDFYEIRNGHFARKDVR